MYGNLPYDGSASPEPGQALEHDQWQSPRPTERLEARITPDKKDLFKRAASLRGVTLTDFVVSSVHEVLSKRLKRHT